MPSSTTSGGCDDFLSICRSHSLDSHSLDSLTYFVSLSLSPIHFLSDLSTLLFLLRLRPCTSPFSPFFSSLLPDPILPHFLHECRHPPRLSLSHTTTHAPSSLFLLLFLYLHTRPLSRVSSFTLLLSCPLPLCPALAQFPLPSLSHPR